MQLTLSPGLGCDDFRFERLWIRHGGTGQLSWKKQNITKYPANRSLFSTLKSLILPARPPAASPFCQISHDLQVTVMLKLLIHNLHTQHWKSHSVLLYLYTEQRFPTFRHAGQHTHRTAHTTGGVGGYYPVQTCPSQNEYLTQTMGLDSSATGRKISVSWDGAQNTANIVLVRGSALLLTKVSTL